MTQFNQFIAPLRSSAYRLCALLVSAFLIYAPANAQGWEKILGGDRYDQGEAIIQTVDLGYIVVGYSESFPQGTDQDVDIYVIKTDVDGTVVWQKTYDPGFDDFGKAAIQTEDLSFLIAGETSSEPSSLNYQPCLVKLTDRGEEEWDVIYDLQGAKSIRIADFAATPDGQGYLLVGTTINEANEQDAFLMKVDEAGQELWRKTIDQVLDVQINAVTAYKQGYVLTGDRDSSVPPPTSLGKDIITYYVDANGTVIWEQSVETNDDEVGNDVIATLDGNIVVAGRSYNDVGLWKYDEAGNLLWETAEDAYPGGRDEINAIIQLPKDSSLVIAGSTEISATDINFLTGKFTNDGTLVWFNNTGRPLQADIATSIASTRSGNFIMTGYTGQVLSLVPDVALTLTDQGGFIHTSYIQGKIFYDDDDGCDYDANEQPFYDWIVRATGDEVTYFGAADENGDFLIRVDTGDYVVEAIPANTYWESCLPNGVNLPILNLYDTTQVNFPMKVMVPDCPYMEVDVSTPLTSPCFSIPYTVSYANNGTGDASNSYVEIVLDNTLTLLSASLPWTQDGNVYTFDLGDVPFNTRGEFTLEAEQDCSSIAEDQATAVSARIFPDDFCLPPNPDWDGSNVKVDGVCLTDTDSVRFVLHNNGSGDMTEARTFFVVEEDLVILMEIYDLEVGQEIERYVATDGATVRMIAEQVSDHPATTFSTDAIEGCVQDGNSYSTGYIADWPEDDFAPNVSIHVSSYNELDETARLVGYPEGYQDSIVSATTPITYRYLFRNLGQEDVSRVVIRDTLSEYLDISTLQAGASSHPFDIEVYHTGVVKITFEDIHLPSEDGPNGFGFVELKINQKKDNPNGTVIDNQAIIIFDYYEPIFTNRIRHVVGAGTLAELVQLVPTSIPTPPKWVPDFTVDAYPNPMSDHMVLEVQGWTLDKELELTLYNTFGQTVRQDVFRNQRYVLPRADLPTGTYYYALRSEGHLVGGGTLIAR